MTKPPPTLESLRVDPGAFDAMVDRSAGGPTYRRVIVILKGVIAVVALAAVVGVLVTLLALARFAQVIERLDTNAESAEAQRVLLLEQGKVLVECTTPSPPPGVTPPKGDDGAHECFDSSRERSNAVVAAIARTQIAIAECAKTRAVDMTACVEERTPSVPLP